MSKKILILHGWLHSAERYLQLKNDLEGQGHTVDTFEFPGFGDTECEYKSHIFMHYVLSVRKLIRENDYDHIIAHSMGANILLKAAENQDFKANLILLSPACYGIDHLRSFSFLIRFLPRILRNLKRLDNGISVSLIKAVSLLTVNKWDKIDDIIVRDVYRADPHVAAKTLYALMWDKWRTNKECWSDKKIYLILGENDRVVLTDKVKELISDIPITKAWRIKGIGHTAVVENYDKLLEIIGKILQAE